MTSMKFMKRAYLASAAATALTLAMSATAIAQDADTEVEVIEDEIVATGIRQSIANSLKLKRESSSIVEAISSEDIGKLPDVSIADSLARLPGVTAQRVRGRAQSISIRGLGPDFSVALLNGREQVSASNNRGIEFDQFPSELISSGIVYKTPDARLAATGIAGAVDLRTVRPLDYTETKINASAKYVINDSGSLNPDFSDDGYRLFGSYIGQFADDRIGLALAITDQSNPTNFTSRELKTNSGQVSQDANGVYYPTDNPRTGVSSRSFKRTSIAGTLQFEPNDRFQATVDAYYSDFEDAGIFRGVETPLASWSGANFDGLSGAGPFADSATYSNVGPIVRTDEEGNTAEILSLGLNTSFMVTENLKVIGDFSTSSLDKSDIDYESYAGTGRGIIGSGNADLLDVLTYTFPEEGDYSINAGRDYTDPGTVLLTDPGGWGQVGFIKEPQIEDDLDQIRLEAEYQVDKSFIESVVVGALFTDRLKTFDSNEAFLRPGNGFVDSSQAIPSGAIRGVTDDGGTGLPVIAYDTSNLIENGTYSVEAANSVFWSVDEKIDTFYGMVNISEQLGNVPVRGNFGLQYVDVTQSSTGEIQNNGNREIQTFGDTYDHWLPSANLSFEVAEDTFLRLAVAKSVTRPRLDQLAANQNINVNSLVCEDLNDDGLVDNVVRFEPTNGRNCFNVDGGNPFLRPYQSTSFDASVEKYFGDVGAIAIAVYHKDLSDYVLGSSRLTDISSQIEFIGFGPTITANPELAVNALSTQENVQDGSITGVEATLRLSFDNFLPESLQGFGFNGSYTYADTSVDGLDGNPVQIPGFSSDVAAAEIYYENHGFRARVNTRYRSGFLSEVPQFDGSLVGADALSETIIDAQIGYEWDEGPLEGFSVNIEGSNLTNEPFRTENDLDGTGPGTDTFVSRYEQYGRTFNFTVAKKF